MAGTSLKPLCNPQKKKGYSPTIGLVRRQPKYPRLILGPVWGAEARQGYFSKGLELQKNSKESSIIAYLRYEDFEPSYVQLTLGQRHLEVKGLAIRSIKSLVLREYRKYWKRIILNAQVQYKKYKGVYLDE